jgi:hypothetical protein
MTYGTAITTNQLLGALFIVCVIGQAAILYLVRRCFQLLHKRQEIHIRLSLDQALIDEIAEDAAEQLDARGVFAGERVMH